MPFSYARIIGIRSEGIISADFESAPLWFFIIIVRLFLVVKSFFALFGIAVILSLGIRMLS